LHWIIGVSYCGLGESIIAIEHLESAVKARYDHLVSDHNNTINAQSSLAVALSDAGQLTKALPLYEETLQLRKAKLGPDHPSTLDSMNNLAGCQIQRGFAHLQHGRLTEDEVACRECRDVRKKLAPDAWTTFTTESMLGEALLGQKKYA